MMSCFLSAALLLSACDAEEENIDWRAGDSLIIQGSAAVAAGTEGEPYYVEGFTVAKEYTWTVNGSSITPARGGEFIMVDFPAAGTYNITVSDGTYEGEHTVTVE
ncbi:hypothetical protein [Catalinimonas niigatensis]|uniref:hypothetical protein n=1 Tax=Catalinimonas niigatensis TaxID=1397264 RepID=UPI0026656B70|nr:hypothetical protein [Catalinimonas niigatensis]WPP49259.1 hypothetical protein PZB72_21560 [Catalinimonas niigatensis]